MARKDVGSTGAAESIAKDAVTTAPAHNVAEVPVYSWAVLAVLLLVYVSNQWTRNILPYVVNFNVPESAEAAKEYMNVALGFDQTAYSVLASFGFTLLYSGCSLIAGRAVDTMSKKGTTVLACLSWSAVTAGQGLSNSFPEVFGLRVLQGIAQAFTTPAAYTLLADAFPASSRATANSVYSSGVYFGGACASLTVLLTSQIGWRDCSLLAGSIGIATALLAQLVLKEPEPSDTDQTVTQKAVTDTTADKSVTEASEGVAASLNTVFSSKTARLVYAAAAVRFMAGFGIGIWAAPYFRGAFPDDATQYAVINAGVVAVGGVSSAILGGWLSDKLAPIDVRYRAWVPAVGCVLAMPAWAAVVSTDSFYTAMACLFAEYVVAECWFGPTVTILQGAVPYSVRGTAQGVFSMLTAVGNIAPVAIGALSANYPLQDVLLYSIPSLYAVSAVLFYLTGESAAIDAKALASSSSSKNQ